jgi:glutamate-1-semialdehyde 2,1-aminomutase
MISAAVPCAEKVRLVSSGTEAGMTALRIARAATNKQRIIKFDGCYHGHSDALLVRAGSGGMTLGVPDSAGVPSQLAELTSVADYNWIESVAAQFEAHKDQIAAVIVEPIAANMGVVPPSQQFLAALSDLAHRNGALVVADEVITGFRLRFGTIAETLGLEPDLIMLGKIIGGGMPIGAVTGPARYLDLLAPIGPVYQAGTLSGNPLSVRAGIETLKILQQPGTYERLAHAGQHLENGLKRALRASGVPGTVNRAGSLLTMFLGPESVRTASDTARCDRKLFARFFHAMIERGINLPPSQFEAWFVSLAHTEQDLDQTIAAAEESLTAATRS